MWLLSGYDYNMIVDVVLVYVGTDHKGVIALRQFHSKLAPNLISKLRYDFAGLKGLPEMIGNHVILTALPSRLLKIFLLRKQKLRVGSSGVARITGYQFAVIRFLRMFYIVDNISDCR